MRAQNEGVGFIGVFMRRIRGREVVFRGEGPALGIRGKLLMQKVKALMRRLSNDFEV